MEQQNENKGFCYTYSAKEQEELKRIREKYLPQESGKEDKLARLRRLDARVTQRAQVVSLVFGILGALILGSGMSLIMTDFSAILGSLEAWALPIGILLGLLGGVLVSLAYPMYRWVTARERRRVTPEILRLTEELLK